MKLLVLLVLVGVVVAVSPFCLRPMLRGRHPVPTREGHGSPSVRSGAATADLDSELRRARAELARLRRRRGWPDAPTATGGERLSAPVAVAGWRRYLPVNMSRAEQVVRVAAGLTIAVIAVLVLPHTVGGWRVGLAVLSGLTVVDLVVSGLIGHCPLHRFLRMPWEPGGRNVGTPLASAAPTDKVSP
ncbi:DUF2892 domain-containing protein [Streptomyces sp. NPDC006385]|uniref:YgaP family membrane protein n=1 Tax=Streptomyces sp. NPDC006385 TaxID=3156761 RepID=UPI0033B1B1F4